MNKNINVNMEVSNTPQGDTPMTIQTTTNEETTLPERSYSSNIDRLFYTKNQSSSVEIKNPEHFLKNVEEVHDDLILMMSRFSTLLSMASSGDDTEPSSRFVSECAYYIGTLADYAAVFRSLEGDAKRELLKNG